MARGGADAVDAGPPVAAPAAAGRPRRPKEYAPYLANGHAACAPPPEGFVCVYTDALDAGMRVPLHGFHAALLRHYGLAPAQLAPNAWRYVAAFVLLCQDAGVEPMLSVFQHFFSICTHKGDAAGWHHFKPSNHAGSSRRLFSGKISKTMYAGWKNRFFFLKAPQDAPWPCPVKWGKPTRVAVRKPGLTAAASAAVEKLLDRVGSSGINVAPFLSRRSPPVGRTPEPAAVKKEPGTTVEQTRKRKSAEPVDATTSTPTGSAAHRAGPPACSAAAGEGERSATASLSLASRLAQMVEAELHEKEQELQARDGEVARLKEKLQAEIDARAADAVRFGDELAVVRDNLAKINDKHAAEVTKLREEACRLKEELQKARSVKTQHQRKVVELRQLVDDLAAMHELLPDDVGLPSRAQNKEQNRFAAGVVRMARLDCLLATELSQVQNVACV
ncbi:hypothetical protein EJB05_09480, partial [Eragrostis curvula]